MKLTNSELEVLYLVLEHEEIELKKIIEEERPQEFFKIIKNLKQRIGKELKEGVKE